jgi:hypothetical protein
VRRAQYAVTTPRRVRTEASSLAVTVVTVTEPGRAGQGQGLAAVDPGVVTWAGSLGVAGRGALISTGAAGRGALPGSATPTPETSILVPFSKKQECTFSFDLDSWRYITPRMNES